MIVVAGESLVDLIVAPDGRVEAVPGGGPFNTARTIARLGGRCTYLGRLSTDRFGRLLRGRLEADGVELGFVRNTDAPSTLAVAELDEDGSATYRFYLDGTSAPGLAIDDIGEMPVAVPAVHAGSLGLVLEPMASTIEALVGRLPAGACLMVDPNCRPAVIADEEAYRRRLERILKRADVVKASVDDLAYLAPGVPPRDAARALLGGGAAVVLLTDGSGSVVVVTAAWESTVGVPVVPVVDTVGSGDAFGGAFLAWWVIRGQTRRDLLDREAVERAVARAIEVAALTCQRAGADPPFRGELASGAEWLVGAPGALPGEPRS